MKTILSAIVPVAIAALGGALAVYAGYDDSPGGTFLGFALIVGAMVYSGRAVRRSPSGPQL